MLCGSVWFFNSSITFFYIHNIQEEKMAPKFSSHSRSISLPSSSHPLITNVEEHLQRLKSSNGDACQKLDGLRNLYECVDDVLQLPLSQQLFSHQEQILDGSLRLLDICGSVRDIYSQMKESVHELESSLRRKRSSSDQLKHEIQNYTISRKQMRKTMSKCYREMKNLAVVKEDSESTIPLVNLMKQVQEVSVNVLESTLSEISPSKAGSNGWSLVSKLLQQQNGAQPSSHIPLIQKVQDEMKSYKEGDAVQMRKVAKHLEEVGSIIQELAEVLDIVFRHLLKTRVSLLNILNH